MQKAKTQTATLKVRSNRTDGEASRQRILDSAEKLFSDTGFHATSIRDIAARAGCQFALVGYHFGTKAELLDHVLARRSEVLGHERMQRLDELRARNGARPIPLRHLIDSYVEAIMERSGCADEGWRNYSRLIAIIGSSAEWSDLTDKHFNAVAREYLVEMQRTLPELSAESLHHAFSFIVGALILVCARSDRVETLSRRQFDSREVVHLTEKLCAFLEGGCFGVVKLDRAARSPPTARRSVRTAGPRPPPSLLRASES